MSTASTAGRLEALRKILASEAQGGFADKTVIGGLDAFLRTLGADAQGGDAALRALADRGMLSIDYAALDPARRKRWSEEVGRILGAAAPPSAQGATRSARAAPGARGERGQGRAQGRLRR